MRTTLDIDEDLLKNVIRATGAPSKKRAIETALREFLRAKRLRELSELIDNYEDFDMTLEELEGMRRES